MKVIPLNNGYAVQRFRVQLNNHYLVFRLHWLTRFNYFCVDIYEQGEPCILALIYWRDLIPILAR